MSFAAQPIQQGIEVLQRSLSRGRLGHAYLFYGERLENLDGLAKQLVKTVNCEKPRTGGPCQAAIDCCDECSSCRRLEAELHPDMLWVRPESKSRTITIDQIRSLLQTVHLKPTEARFKAGIIQAADRMNSQAANAFLKTLEEPPANSLLILTSVSPDRLLETILSRCLRVHFWSGTEALPAGTGDDWLDDFATAVARPKISVLERYGLLDRLLQRLAALKEQIESALTERSPLKKYHDLEPGLREKYEDELTAAVEAEYRRQRAEALQTVLSFWRDVWVKALSPGCSLLTLPKLASQTSSVASRLNGEKALENLEIINRAQRLLFTNVQEALTLEVAFLKLHL